MKNVIMLMAMFLSLNAFAGEKQLDCKVTEVLDYTVFEESLSVEEYPNVEVTYDDMDGYQVYLGSNIFNLDNYNTITLEPVVGMDSTYIIENSNDNDVILVTLEGVTRQGKITVKTSEKDILVATMNCK